MLMIDDRVPHLDLGAGYPRANALLNGLLPAFEAITLYPLVFPAEPDDAMYRDVDRSISVLADRRKPGLAASLHEYAELGYDVLWVSRPDNMRDTLIALDAQPGLRERFFIVYDAEALYAPRVVRQRVLAGRPLSHEGATAMLAAELAMAARADLLVSVGGAEAHVFREQTGRPCVVLGFSTTAQSSNADYSARSGFGFVGAIGVGSPNEDSLLWYVANVMHSVYARTGSELRVVGHLGSTNLLFYASPEIRFLGQLAQLETFFEEVRVFIAPTRFAAGMPQKLIDAASYGVPIVATSLLAGQLGWTHGRELLVADDRDAFADACVALYGDPDLWQSLRQNALSSVRKMFGPQPFARELDEVVAAIRSGLERAVAAKAPAPRTDAEKS